jgi:hypothetical protein
VRRSAGWKLLHSLWIVPALLFGLGTWLSFGYIAARHRRLSWLIAAAAYLVLGVTAFALIGSGPEQVKATETGPIQTDIGMVIGLLAWPAGVLHALWVNMTVRLPLLERADHDRWAGGPPVTAPSPGSRPFR